jgi:uncharacterized protein (TIGR00251 family)
MNYKNAISISNEEVRIKIHVISGSLKSFFPARYNQWRDCIEINVKSEAKENKANIEVVTLISNYLKIPTKNVRIVTGQKSKDKIVSINCSEPKSIGKKIEDLVNDL